MDHIESGKYWNENAEVWTRLAREGYDIYRNYLNTPAFFSILPEIRNLKGIDIGCGEGYNTRLLAAKGAHVTGLDISEIFIQKAIETENNEPQGITYIVGSAVHLPFTNNSFDFATGFMSFMDVPETDKVLIEAYRVLKPGGFLQFSITHPCFFTKYRKLKRDWNNKTYAVEIGGYFDTEGTSIEEWIFTGAPKELANRFKKFKVPVFRKTLSDWLNIVINCGFVLERVNEPTADDEVVRQHPKLQDTQVIPYFLHLRCRKPQ
jgi:ubiquinone/menaquinone biosynthesis C-methylase UbiE